MIGAYLRKRMLTFRSYAKQPIGNLTSIFQTSFDRLSQSAKELIQLCSLIGNTNIPTKLLEGGEGVIDWIKGKCYRATLMFGVFLSVCIVLLRGRMTLPRQHGHRLRCGRASLILSCLSESE
jgi:hypothetical protein